MVTSLKRSHACTATVHAHNLAAGHHQPRPSLETPKHPQASLLWGHCLFLLGPGADVTELNSHSGKQFSTVLKIHSKYTFNICWAFLSKMRKLISLVHFSHSVVPDSLWPHLLQLARLPCPSPTLELAQTHVHQVSDATQQSHPLYSPSPLVFTFPASGSFPVSQFFIPGGQSSGSSV